MKTVNKLIAVFTVVMMVMAFAGAFANYEYNEHDVAAVTAFLEQEVNGVKNGNFLYGDAYKPYDPSTWQYIVTENVEGFTGNPNNPVFTFDYNGRLVSIDFVYQWSEVINGIHADGYRCYPVGGEFHFDGCTALREINTDAPGLNSMPSIDLSNNAPDFRERYYGLIGAYKIYTSIPGGIGEASFTCAFDRLSLYGNTDYERIVYADLYAEDYPYGTPDEEKSMFIGWFDRFTGELYSEERSLVLSGNDITYVLEARYETSPEFKRECGENKLPTGDVNLDHIINTGDVATILQSLVQMSVHIEPLLSDVNADGHINTGDASALLKLLIRA
ncbi:MAG: dockerin type I repeat-containing protein [Clostridia bacterium]